MVTPVETESSTVPGWIARLDANQTQSPSAWEARREIVVGLGKAASESSGELREDAYQVLLALSQNDESDAVRRSAREAVRSLWDANWASGQPSTLTQVLQALSENPDPLLRQEAVDWVRSQAGPISQDDRMLTSALDTLLDQANHDLDPQVKLMAWDASRKIGESGWASSENPETHQKAVFNRFLKVLRGEEDDRDDWEIRKAAVDWFGGKAEPIATSDSMASVAIQTLIERTSEKEKEDVRKSASEALRKIWDAGWKTADNALPETRLIAIGQVLLAFQSPGADGSLASQTAVAWLAENAKSIAASDRAIYIAVLDTLVDAAGHMDNPALLLKTLDAVRKIWDGVWQGQDGHPDSQPALVINQVLKALKKDDTDGDYRKVREAAAGWLGDRSVEIAADIRLANDALNVLFKSVTPNEKPNVRRTAKEASRKIWDEVWESGRKARLAPITLRVGGRTNQVVEGEPAEIGRQAVLSQVLKVLEKSDDWEFKQAAVQWLGEKAAECATSYDLAEQVANALAEIRDGEAQREELKEAASRALLALWAGLQKEYPLADIKKKFEQDGEEDKIKTIRKLANPNTLGSREGVNFLVEKWVEWVSSDTEKRLVEIASSQLRFNDHAVLPLAEQFLKNWDETPPGSWLGLHVAIPGFVPRSEAAEVSAAEKRLRVRQRAARQLADMSDPRYFDPGQAALYRDILYELRNHAIPALARRLPEEKDVTILENMARVLLYSQEREGIDALALEIVGEERTRKARQELLATYYLEPSKARSEQAAEILNNAIQESKRTLRILQTLNLAVVVVGLAVLAYGLYFSIWGEGDATRITGGLAAIGGLGGVLYQMVRKPLDRIQSANSNLVQMETAFTSFIWELNLNGTFIQSSYVNNGELSRAEIDATDRRIEEAMKVTMGLVSIFTEEGRQSLTTRLNKLEPAAGKGAGTEITIYGQFLNGEPFQASETPSVEQPATDLATLGRQRLQKLSHQVDRALAPRPAGMVALNHIPVEGQAIIDWQAQAVRFKLSEHFNDGQPSETVWVSLFVDGMETNALPFYVIRENGVEEGA